LASVPGDSRVHGAFIAAVQRLVAEPAFSDLEIVEQSARRHSGVIVCRLTIDRPGGIDIATCTMLSRRLNEILEAEPEEYTLEVASAGLERPLLSIEHYARFQGKRAKVKTRVPLDGSKTHRGIIAAVVDDVIVLHHIPDRPGAASTERRIPFESIAEGNLEIDLRAALSRAQQRPLPPARETLS